MDVAEFSQGLSCRASRRVAVASPEILNDDLPVAVWKRANIRVGCVCVTDDKMPDIHPIVLKQAAQMPPCIVITDSAEISAVAT